MQTISVIIPIYNEEKVIEACLASLSKQTLKPREVLIVDDGSTDGSKKFATLFQDHKGPGAARNLAAKKAKGDILVFVDADMEFDPNFLAKLVAPIEAGKAIGTFTNDEYLLNKDQPLARCWNLNLGKAANKMLPENSSPTLLSKAKSFYKKLESNNVPKAETINKNRVYRAILKSEFESAGGFAEDVGYTDDWSIGDKLGVLAELAPGAIVYHKNPETLHEVWVQARWFGKNEFLTKNLTRKLFNLLRYNPLTGLFFGIVGALKFKEPAFLPFKLVYDSAIFASVILSFLGEKKHK